MSRQSRLHEYLRKNMELTINDYQMIASGDRIIVGISGGVDSFALLKLLTSRKIYVPNDITVIAVHVDLGFQENPPHLVTLQRYLEAAKIPFEIADTKIGPNAHGDKNRKNPCFLCARLRRRQLFEAAARHNATKIALGHHKDDIIETFLLNIFFSREISTMLPKQTFFDGKFQIIRPLAYLEESELKKYHREMEFPVFGSGCPTDGNSKREYVKKLLRQMEYDYRGIKKNIYKAIKNVNLEYLLPDRDINPR